MAEDDHAVIVGVTRYPGLSDLKGPENDALAIREWLVDPDGGAVPAANVRMVVSSAYVSSNGSVKHAEPTNHHVYDAFEELIALGRERAPEPAGRRLYVFMAGHGAANPSDVYDAVLLMANARLGAMGYNVAGKPIAGYFSGAAYFKEIVMLMDCCRDALPRAPLAALPWDTVNNNGADAEFFFGFATRWSRKARERKFDDEGWRGLFTKSVIEGLRAGQHTPQALREFVKQHLPTIDGGDYQKPHFDASDWGMQLAAGGVVERPHLRVSFPNPDPRVTVTVKNGDLAIVASHPLEGGPWEVELDIGLYVVERSDGQGERSASLTGGVVDVEI